MLQAQQTPADVTFLPPEAEGADADSASALDDLLNMGSEETGSATAKSSDSKHQEVQRGFDLRLKPHLSRLAVALIELINSRRFEPVLGINIQAAAQVFLPQPKKLQEPAVRDYILKLRRLVASHTVAIFYRDPETLAKQEVLRNEVRFNPEVDDAATNLSEEELVRNYKLELSESRQKWRKFYHSQRIIPLEVDLDRVVVDSIAASRLVGRPSHSLSTSLGNQAEEPRLASSTGSTATTNVVASVLGRAERTNEKIALAFDSVNSAEKQLWFEALSAITNNAGGSDPEFPAFFIRGVYSGSAKQFAYMKHRPSLFKVLSSGDSHHLTLKQSKKEMNLRQRRGIDRESTISSI